MSSLNPDQFGHFIPNISSDERRNWQPENEDWEHYAPSSRTRQVDMLLNLNAKNKTWGSRKFNVDDAGDSLYESYGLGKRMHN